MTTAVADPTLASIALLDDPSKWHVVPGVPVFKPHKRWKRFDDTGKPLAEPVLLYEVTEKDLPEIAANVQALEREAGVASRMTIGHTATWVPETEQPPLVGLARNYRHGTFGPKSQPAILADLYYRKEDWNEAKKYPFRSVEYYHRRKEIRGLALLLKDPELDLGMTLYQQQQNYAGQEPCYYYCSGADAMPDSTQVAEGIPVQNYAGGIKPKFLQKLKAHLSHAYPHFDAMHKNYEGTAAPAAGPAAGPGTPGSTNVAPPKPLNPAPAPAEPDKEAQLMSADNEQARREREDAVIRVKRLEEELAAMKEQFKKQDYARQEAECVGIVQRLQAERYQIKDPQKMVAKMTAMTPEQRTEYLEEIAQHYHRVPGNDGFIPTGAVPGTPGAKKTTKEMHTRAVKLATSKGISYDDALAEIKKA